MRKKILLIILLLSSNFIIAQQIRINAGFAGYGNPFDGLYASFDVGIPIYKGIELAPTFTFNTNIKHDKIEYYQNDYNNETIYVNKNNSIGGRTSSLFELYLLINPVKLIKKNTKVDLALGVGYGFNIYSSTLYNFDPENNYTLIGIHNKSGICESLSYKIFYNYHFKKMFIGVIFGIVDTLAIAGDGNSILGIQFGKNL